MTSTNLESVSGNFENQPFAPFLTIWKRLLEERANSESFQSSEMHEFFIKNEGEGNIFEMLLHGQHAYISKFLTNLLNEEKHRSNHFPLRALAVFSASKLFGRSEALERMSTDVHTLVEFQHLMVGYAVELLYWSQILHYTTTETISDKTTKLKILVGDFLITKFYTTLAALNSTFVFNLMSSTLSKFSENAFKNDNVDCGTPPMFALAFNSTASLSGYDQVAQSNASSIGFAFGQTYERYCDIQQRRQNGRKDDDLLNSRCLSGVAQTMALAHEFFPVASTLKDAPFFQILKIIEDDVLHLSWTRRVSP